MIIALWIVNAVLAVLFMAVGVLKLFRPREALTSSGMLWASETSAGAVKAIGSVEVLGGLGLVLPLAIGIATVLTPLAATGLVVLMTGAIVIHVRRKESFVVPAVLLIGAAASAVLGFVHI